MSEISGFTTRSLAYDSCANGLGMLCSVTDDSGSTQFQYDWQGNRTLQQNTIAGTAYTSTFAYDALGRLTQIGYPDGKSASYGYGDGALRSISATPNGASQSVASSMTYQPFGPLTGLTFGNGLARTNNYDSSGRLSSAEVKDPSTSTIKQSLTFAWNANDLVAGITNGRSTALNQTFTYDELARLATVGRGDGTSESYSYDANGNRTASAVAGVSSSWVYSTGNNRLASATTGSTSRIWTYDANGRQNGFIGQDGLAVGLSYGEYGRVQSSSRQGVSTAYSINAFGNRVRKWGAAGDFRFIYTPEGYLLAEYSSGAGWTDYIQNNGEAVAAIRNNSLLYIHNDGLGRPEVVTNGTKAVVWSASNYAFTRSVTADSIGGLNVGFPGQYWDQETGTWYNVQRDVIDQSTGRYAAPDPVGLLAGPNLYAYVSGNPVNVIDPLGLEGINAGTFPPGQMRDEYLAHQNGPRGPDLVNVTLSLGFFSIDKTITRSGAIFSGGGVTAPPSIKAPQFSVSFGFMDGCPTAKQVDAVVSGGTSSVGFYRGIGGGFSWNGTGSYVSMGFGIGGASGGYSQSAQTGTLGSGWR